MSEDKHETTNEPSKNRPATPVESSVKQEQPQAATPAEPVAAAAKTNPGLLVLQWLVYAFWGWSALATSWLAVMAISFLFDADKAGHMFDVTIAYALAATVVLYLIALVSDIFYLKHEPAQKTGGTMVIMIIHAVIFALFGIGWLIAAVFGGVQLLIGDSDELNGTLAFITTALLMTVVYGATLLRTLRPAGRTLIPRIYWIAMTVLVVALVVVASVGPAARVRLAKADEQIEQGLPNISSAISSYTAENDKLPASLDDIKSELRGDALEIVDAGKVRYTPKEKLTSSASARELARDDNSNVRVPPISQDEDPVYHYELCATYATESEYYDEDRPYPAIGRVGYETTPDTYNHPAGEVCYDLQTGYSYGY